MRSEKGVRTKSGVRRGRVTKEVRAGGTRGGGTKKVGEGVRRELREDGGDKWWREKE